MLGVKALGSTVSRPLQQPKVTTSGSLMNLYTLNPKGRGGAYSTVVDINPALPEEPETQGILVHS